MFHCLLLLDSRHSESNIKGSGADQCRHHVTCLTAPCIGSVHFVRLLGVGFITTGVFGESVSLFVYEVWFVCVCVLWSQ